MTPRRNLAADTLLIAGRELAPVARDPFSLTFGLIQPLFFLLLFGPLLHAEAGSSWAWFVPGVLVMVVLFATAGAGSNLQMDLVTGTHERLLVTPVARPALILGKALKEFAPLVGQALVIVLVMVPFGFRPHPVGALLGLLLLGVLGLGIGSLSYALALAVRNQDPGLDRRVDGRGGTGHDGALSPPGTRLPTRNRANPEGSPCFVDVLRHPMCGPSGRLVETRPASDSDGASAPVDPREKAQDAPLEAPTAASAASIRRRPSTSGSRLRCGRVTESRGPTGRSWT